MPQPQSAAARRQQRTGQQGWQTGTWTVFSTNLQTWTCTFFSTVCGTITTQGTVRSTWCNSHVVTCCWRVSVFGSQTMQVTSRVRCSNLHSVTVRVCVLVSQWYSQT